ncbi:BZ3500_MvSof-1268-A1-R1_Chr8-2g10178 [Microbotryum saponariae]|uniref:BZ3500_MvSof-1268-A1-R1_Chr8-2g10178 protein n=1 Tax=Microbotryum saponariae TaxID=289078 RepID=A0A2X0MUZ4_9BASI|nr:BZ3500_MvSof-1268-A1-R1_Chr8-2g10178 [Microbotryum saponariae]SDA01942.1 BZ3501_MvSof-1269-A2-R1_Chr8-2g09928 [Microbotryum saponariae]
MTLGPHSPSRRASCSRLYRSLVIFCNHFSAEAHDNMIPCLFLDEDQDYYLNDDDFDRLSPLTNMTIAELLAFDVAPADASLHIELSKDEPNQYSTLPYPTLQTRDAFLATDALINAPNNGFRSLAVASTRLPLGADRLWSQYDRAEDVQSWALRAQRWMVKIVVINGTDRNPSSCVLVTTQPTHLKLPSLVDARDTNFSLNWANLIAHRAAHECSHLRAVLLKGRPMESSHTSRGEAGVGISNTEQGRSAVHSRVLKGLVQSMGPSRFEDMAGTARSFRWTGGGQVARALTTNDIQKNAYIEDGRIQEKLPERTKQYGALAQRYPHFGSLDGAVTTATPLEIGSLICFGLKLRDIYSKVTTNHCNRDTLPSLVLLSNVVVQELRLIKKACYSTHLIDGTMPFRMIDGRQVIESLGPPATTYRSTTDLTSCYPDERIITCAIARQAHQQSKEGLFDAWSHARHQPKRRGPQATFDRPPRVRKRSERVFEDF